MRRAVLVVFCLALLAALVFAFTRVVVARVPQQRATLEKLINDRTGLAVRFENVHFAWTLEGTRAVFTRVELTDPRAGRVRVTAPELRVELDTWDFLRHHQLSFGHVTLSSPDIEIIGDPDDATSVAAAQRTIPARAAATGLEETALVRRYTGWAELMPTGRIEVEGARVHLKRRGDSAPRLSFTLSQAVVSRGAGTFNAFGTMLLSQDVGPSLFVSAKLDGLAPGAAVSGDLRVIARRVFLDRLGVDGLDGRGTLDAKLLLKNGRIDSAHWQASARELAVGGDEGSRFDHLTVTGKLERDRDEMRVTLGDLQISRGAELDRVPSIAARLSLAPGTLRLERTRVFAERLPFMSAQLLLNLVEGARPGTWTASQGELHSLEVDSGEPGAEGAWTADARVTGLALIRPDRLAIERLAGRFHASPRAVAFDFDPASPVALRTGDAAQMRELRLAGSVTFGRDLGATTTFEGFSAKSDSGTFTLDGSWGGDSGAAPLAISLGNLERPLALDLWKLLAADRPLPKPFERLVGGRAVAGRLELASARATDDPLDVDWRHSSGNLSLADLATSGNDGPALTAGSGTLRFSQGNAQLLLDHGRLEDLALSGSRVDWPRDGVPRLHATLAGPISSKLLQSTLAQGGLDRLKGTISLQADARGERAMRDPASWRVTAQVTDASIPLAPDLPAISSLAGTLRYGEDQLRSLTLSGRWLGGPVTIESRRATSHGAINVAANGTAEAGPLLELLGQYAASERVDGQLSWSGTAKRAPGTDAWQISLASNLVGLGSRLPEPFDKPAARAVPASVDLRVDSDGVRDFAFEGGRDFSVRGQVRDIGTSARFEWQGVIADLSRASRADAQPTLTVESLDVRKAPQVFAIASALLPASSQLTFDVKDVRQRDESLGPLQASISRDARELTFTLDTPGSSAHQLSARGRCREDRCDAEFTADTSHLAALMRGVSLPAEWPTESMHASGELSWPMAADSELLREMAGKFDLETQGADSNHTLAANATLAGGAIELTNVQGTGPTADQVFHGKGRVGLIARDYDLSVDYEQVSLAASAVPTSARARFAHVWNALRGTVARKGADDPQSKRVQWHGSWDAER